MATLLRVVLWLVWSGAMGWLWHAQALSGGMALTGCALGLVLFAWPGTTARRRRGRELRYVEIGKQPMTVR
jgi:hypothetical protein